MNYVINKFIEICNDITDYFIGENSKECNGVKIIPKVDYKNMIINITVLSGNKFVASDKIDMYVNMNNGKMIYNDLEHLCYEKEIQRKFKFIDFRIPTKYKDYMKEKLYYFVRFNLDESFNFNYKEKLDKDIVIGLIYLFDNFRYNIVNNNSVNDEYKSYYINIFDSIILYLNKKYLLRK